MPDQHFYLFVVIASVIAGVIVKFMPSNAKANIQQAQGEAKPTMNWLWAKLLKKNIDATTEVDNSLTQQVIAIDTLEKTPLRLQELNRVAVANHNNSIRVIEDSTEAGLLPVHQQQLKLSQGQAQIEVLRDRGLKENEWELEKKKHWLDIEGAKQLGVKGEIDVQTSLSVLEELTNKRDEIAARRGDQQLLNTFDDAIATEIKVIRGKGRLLLKEVDWQDEEGTQSDSED